MESKFFVFVRLVGVVVLCVIGSTVLGQSQYPVFSRGFSSMDYKAGSQNWGVASNEDVVYFANNEGLLSFDGQNWRLFELSEKKVVRSVAVVNDTVYTGSYNDFGYWIKDEYGRMTYYSLMSQFVSLPSFNEDVWRIAGSKGYVYFQGFGAIFRYDGKNVQQLETRNMSLLFMHQTGKKLWVQELFGQLFEIVGMNLRPVRGSEGLKGMEVKFIHELPSGELWIATTRHGLFKLQGGKLKPFTTKVDEDLKLGMVDAGAIMDEFLVLGTLRNGLYVIDFEGNIAQHFNTDNHLADNNVHGIGVVSQSRIWVALDEGISYLNFKSGLSLWPQSKSIGVLFDAALHKDSLYLATNRGLYRYDPIAGKHKFEELTGGHSWSLYSDGKELMVGNTIQNFKLSQTGQYVGFNGNGGASEVEVFNRGANYLVQSAFGNMTVYFKSQTGWTYHSFFPDKYFNFEYLIKENESTFWGYHAHRGLCRMVFTDDFLEMVSLQWFGRENQLNIRGACRIDGQVVVLSSDGFFYYNPMENNLIPAGYLQEKIPLEALPEKVVAGDSDNYWFIFENQLELFRIKNQDVQLVRRIPLEGYGLRMVDHFKRILSLSENNYLIPCVQGVLQVVVNPKEGSSTSDSLELKLASVYYIHNNQLVDIALDQEEIRVPHDFEELKFSFSSGAQAAMGLIRHRLVGGSSRYSDWEHDGDVVLNQLPIGRYVLRVELFVQEGLPVLVELPIVVIRPWYWTIWAIMGYLCLLISLGFVISRFLIRNRERHRLQLEEKNRLETVAEQQVEQNALLEEELENRYNELALQASNLVKRNSALQSIQEELDAQKVLLGSRYPNKMFDKLRSLIQDNLNDTSDWLIFEMYFNKTHRDFTSKLIENYEDLTPNDLKICSLLRMNMSSKEIASMLNITLRGVELRRYRLRKRLNLASSDNLVEFLMNY